MTPAISTVLPLTTGAARASGAAAPAFLTLTVVLLVGLLL